MPSTVWANRAGSLTAALSLLSQSGLADVQDMIWDGSSPRCPITAPFQPAGLAAMRTNCELTDFVGRRSFPA